MPTSAFLARYGLQVAVNASAWGPFHAKSWRDYYPRPGDPVDIHGLAVSNGSVVSPDDSRQPRFCVVENEPVIVDADVPPGTTQAVGGGSWLVRDGQVQREGGETRHPRTAVGIGKDPRRLFLVVVDGRQRGYSEGATLHELGVILKDLGAWDALNLDGGGSSTLVVAGRNGKPRVLNAPIHTGIPMRERPVANHLGLKARPDDRKPLSRAWGDDDSNALGSMPPPSLPGRWRAAAEAKGRRHP